MNDISKLPKWAQSEIMTLRQNLKHAEEERANCFERKPTNIEIDGLARHMNKPRIFAPDDSLIEFTLPRGKIQARLVHGKLELMAQALGLGDMLIEPHSSNVIRVGLFEVKK